MVVRRVLFVWQFIAAVVLPIWVLVSHGIILDGIGWDLVLYLVLCPVLCVAMLLVSGLVYARRSARTARALSWLDVGVLSAWQAAILAYGFLTSTGLAVVILLLGAAAFWAAGWQLFTETRTLVKQAFSLDPIDAGSYRAESPKRDDGSPQVIIVNPDGTHEVPPTR
jgi:hypothetical protein